MSDDAQTSASLLAEIWSGYRPYAVALAVDLLISTSLWLILFIFKVLTRWLTISGWAGDFIVEIHSAGAVGSFLVFAILFAVDLARLHRRSANRE